MNIMSIEESQSIFFDNVRRLRKQRGQSLEALEKESGLPLDMLAQLEQNVLPKEMSVIDTCKLAKALGCRACELFR